MAVILAMLGMLLFVLWPLCCLVAFWLAGIAFPETMALLIAWTGLDVAPWQLGFILGMVGACFRSNITCNRD